MRRCKLKLVRTCGYQNLCNLVDVPSWWQLWKCGDVVVAKEAMGWSDINKLKLVIPQPNTNDFVHWLLTSCAVILFFSESSMR